ncbi:hypothetical protein PR003_g14418 [Phytophthora rubi]|uniref:DUSP domain-containing protein n=3 Tax=Phytophthora rubi TaxID=129364 RepID=A0A6A4F3Y6_9STRA|nr:hypothetical protein PR002_g14178 [Phytophthora rubi]KAE9020310.1 hypothetical protein PR001_g13632 [Phytophthora rubi]KAE9332624.1 hypothetical protein PR003_g14418 [Phytophthora rubi]
MATSARWLLGERRHAVVAVEVPAGPLGILLDGDDLDRPVLEGFAPVSPSRPQQRGAVEFSGRVPVGSLLLAVNERDFALEDLGFQQVGQVLRETSHLPRTLKFRVPLDDVNDVPLSQQFAPRRGPPPKEDEEEEEEEEEDEKEKDQVPEVKQVKQQSVDSDSDRDLPLSQQFAPRRGPPPREEEEEEEGKLEDEEEEEEEDVRSSSGDSFQEIHVTEATVVGDVVLASAARLAEDQVSDGSTSWTLTGSNVDGSSSTPLASSVSSASPEKLQQVALEEPWQASQELVQPELTEQPKLPEPKQSKRLSLEIDDALPPVPKELSFGTMAALAETRHFDSDDSSDDSSEDESDQDLGSWGQRSTKGPSWKPAPAAVGTGSSFSPEQPEGLSPHKPSPVPLSMASNVSSGTVAASLMAQTNQFDRDDSIEEDADAEYVTAVAPPGPLGLNLDGGVLDCAVVMGFVKLRDGSKGALERNGDIVPGSVIVRINGEDFSHATLNDVRMKLGELGHQSRTIVFCLPPRQQQQSSVPRSPGMRCAPTLPVFQEDFDKRRKFELALVMHYDKTVLRRRECWFCIDAKWMARWVEFVARGGPEPGPITNENLLHHDWRKMLAHDAPGRPDTAREGLILLKDYRVVAPMVWCLFAELHGLGEAPLLPRYLMDIYAEALSDGEVSNILEVPRPKATVLANDLRDKCLVRPSKTR